MKLFAAFLAGAVLGGAAVWWYAFGSGPGAQPAPLVSSTPAVFVPTVARTPVVRHTPSATAAPSATATPLALRPAKTLPPIQIAGAEDPPKILSVSLNTTVAHSGQAVSGTVRTSSNVASVEVRLAGYSQNMTKTGAGTFAISYRVPPLPAALRHTYLVQVIARNTKGLSVSTAVPITIR